MLLEDPRATVDAYDALAPAYDLLTSGYAYERWLSGLEALAREHGLRGRRVLDVACGTGKSFEPLLDRGFEVTACDGSAEMAALARRRARGRARVHVADMRSLPSYGRFDLVLCLDDAINHLVTGPEVVRALSGMRDNLAPGGLVIFDVNTALAYDDPGELIREGDGMFLAARGGGPLGRPGGVVDLAVDVFARQDDGRWLRRSAAWRHRHYTVAQIRRLVASAGLRLRAVHGQRRGAFIDPSLDEAVHRKAVVVAGESDGEGRGHALGAVADR
jgi:SAM-dependent methyltransferase